jgi:hypothetical protein
MNKHHVANKRHCKMRPFILKPSSRPLEWQLIQECDFIVARCLRRLAAILCRVLVSPIFSQMRNFDSTTRRGWRSGKTSRWRRLDRRNPPQESAALRHDNIRSHARESLIIESDRSWMDMRISSDSRNWQEWQQLESLMAWSFPPLCRMIRMNRLLVWLILNHWWFLGKVLRQCTFDAN